MASLRGTRRPAPVRAAAVAMVVALCVLAAGTAIAEEQDAAAPAGAGEDEPLGARLTVSPLIIDDIRVEPGDTRVENVTVTASGDEPLVVEFRHADFGFHEETYTVDIISDEAPETTEFSTRGWFSVPKDVYRIPAGRAETIPVTIDVPENATPGVHLGAAFFRTVVEASEGGSQVLTATQAGPLLFIEVEGGSLPKPDLREFSVPKFVKHGPIGADLELVNEGDTFFTYEGTVTLSRGDKEWTEEIPLKYVIPGQPRDVRDEDGEKLVFGGRKLEFGRYEVETKLRIEPTGKTITATRTVWVVPAWMRGLAVVLGGVLVGAIGWIGWWWRDRVLLKRAMAEGLLEDAHDDDVASEDELVPGVDLHGVDEDSLGDGDDGR